jgi:hypothetical protein
MNGLDIFFSYFCLGKFSEGDFQNKSGTINLGVTAPEQTAPCLAQVHKAFLS